MLANFITFVLVTPLVLLALTFLVGMAKTIMEGPEAIAEFDRAGFTFGNYWNGTVPGESGICTQGGAEIEWIDGKIHARPTRTIAKHIS